MWVKFISRFALPGRMPGQCSCLYRLLGNIYGCLSTRMRIIAGDLPWMYPNSSTTTRFFDRFFELDTLLPVPWRCLIQLKSRPVSTYLMYVPLGVCYDLYYP
jgi:hypothetical protein